MVQYLHLLEEILTHGKERQSQKPEKTIAITGMQARYDLNDGFPLITTRSLEKSWIAIQAELLWIMSGSTNVNDLIALGSHVWDIFAKASAEKIGTTGGNLGPTYGEQARRFAGKTDQFTQVVNMLKRDLNTRRALISYWNLGDVEESDGKHVVDIAPCVTLLHFLQMEGRLDLHMVQRSADVPVGVPFDIATYGLLLMLVSKEVGLPYGNLVHTLSDAHIYKDQIPAVREILTRTPKKLPTVTITDAPRGSIYDYRVGDFQLNNYDPHPAIKGIPVAT